MTTVIQGIREQLMKSESDMHVVGESRGTRPIAIGVELHHQIDIELVLQDQARGYRLTKRAFVEEAVRKYLNELKLTRAQFTPET